MSRVPHIPRRPTAPPPCDLSPDEAQTAALRLMLAAIWHSSKRGGEMIFGPRDYNAGCSFVAPGRALLTGLAGADWEDTTTAQTIADHAGDLTFDEVFANWLKIVPERTMPTTKRPFKPHADHAELTRLLRASGHLEAQQDNVQWTPKASPAMQAANRWSATGQSAQDTAQSRAKIARDARAHHAHTQAQSLLASMPADLKPAFTAVARNRDIFAAYDWLYAHYTRHTDSWSATPRPLETPSRPGRLNSPGMTLSVAAQMYDIASGGRLSLMEDVAKARAAWAANKKNAPDSPDGDVG